MSTTVTTSRRANPSKVFYWLQDDQVYNLYGFMGGFVDAAGYIKFHGLFTSSITGNLVAAMASVYSSYGILSRVMLAIGFCLGAVFASSIQLRLKLFKGWSTRWLLIFTSLAQIITTAIAVLFGMLYDKYMNDGSALTTWRLIFVSTIISASMGIQNSAVKDNFPTAPSTTVVTMLLVTLSSQGSQALLYYLASLGMIDLNREGQPRPDNHYQSMVLKENESTGKMTASARHLLSFLVGGVIGAVLIHNCTFWSFFVIIAILSFMSLDLYCAHLHDLHEANYKAIEKEVPPQVVAVNSQTSIPVNEISLLVQDPPQEESKV